MSERTRSKMQDNEQLSDPHPRLAVHYGDFQQEPLQQQSEGNLQSCGRAQHLIKG
jgi:hypothetical protein